MWLFCLALGASLSVSALLFFVWTWRWPLVGDSSLIHYIAFLIQRGWAPYRQLGDMNMPGSYLIELAAMHLFGMGDLAWRLFDFTLLGLASASFFVITRPRIPRTTAVTASLPQVGSEWQPSRVLPSWVGFPERWLAGLFAASLFILTHGRDGLAQGGQRDLTMSVCLIAATAFLFLAIRRRSTLCSVAFGLLSGIAMTIKPVTLPITLAQLALAWFAIRKGQESSPQQRTEPARIVVPATIACLLGPGIAFAFLLREHCLPAFLASLRIIDPYYASLGHRSLGFIVVNSLSTLLPLILAWIACLALQPERSTTQPRWERNAILAGIVFGVANCLLQQRALPYYRYPLLVFLLPLIALDLTSALRLSPATSRSRIARVAAILALAIGGFFLAPRSAILIHRDRWWETDFISSLQENLTALGGPSLSGHIQCIDSISGCGNVLYRMRLEPATGVLSDFLLFGSVSDRRPPDTIPIIRDTRASFSAAIVAHPPEVIVVTSHLHMDGPDNFRKLARWPAFAEFLADHYTLRTEWSPTRPTRWWSHEEIPASYRIYVLRSAPRAIAPNSSPNLNH